MAKKNDYEVGYGKPPEHTRFRPGRSGNPKGRSKRISGDEPVEALFLKSAATHFTVIVSGKKRSITSFEAVLVRQFAKAMSGDTRAAREIFKLHDRAAQYRKQHADDAEERRRNLHRQMLDSFFDGLAETGAFGPNPLQEDDDDV